MNALRSGSAMSPLMGVLSTAVERAQGRPGPRQRGAPPGCRVKGKQGEVTTPLWGKAQRSHNMTNVEGGVVRSCGEGQGAVASLVEEG